MKAALCILFAIGALFPVSICVKIEILNGKAGYAIEKKAKYEPDSKWRIGSETVYRMMAEREFRLESGLNQDEPLNKDQSRALKKRIEEGLAFLRPHNELASAMRVWGFWIHPIILLTLLVAGIDAAISRVVPRWFAICVFGLSCSSLIWALYRGYFASLSW